LLRIVSIIYTRLLRIDIVFRQFAECEYIGALYEQPDSIDANIARKGYGNGVSQLERFQAEIISISVPESGGETVIVTDSYKRETGKFRVWIVWSP
jgi:hypothetical protein